MPNPCHIKYLFAVAMTLFPLSTVALADEPTKRDFEPKKTKNTLHKSLTQFDWLIGDWEVVNRTRLNPFEDSSYRNVSVRPITDGKGLRVSYEHELGYSMLVAQVDCTADIVPSGPSEYLCATKSRVVNVRPEQKTVVSRTKISVKTISDTLITGTVQKLLSNSKKEATPYEFRIERGPDATSDGPGFTLTFKNAHSLKSKEVELNDIVLRFVPSKETRGETP